MSEHPATTLDALRARLFHPGQPRLLVSMGGCSQAVQATAVYDALRAEVARRSISLDVVAAGCDGACHSAPSVTLQRPGAAAARWDRVGPDAVSAIVDAAAALPDGGEDQAALPFFAGQQRVLLADAGRVDPTNIGDALQRGRYRGLARALEIGPDAVIAELEQSGLTGRGGAYFPIGTKLRGCRNGGPLPRYLIVNAEEGEPGVFKDRHLLEGDPHLVIEGILIAAYAIDARDVIVYLNGLATVAAERLVAAIAGARRIGLLGESILGTPFGCDIEIRYGAGSYVLGEGSVILESIEGHKPMPRIRPPSAVISGLFSRPTVVNNVETLAAAAIVVDRGAGWYRGLGVERWPGTKLVCVSGDVERPGVVEIGIGTTLRAVVEDLAGGPHPGRSIQAVLTGGPSGVFVPPSLLDRPLVPRDPDVLLGSGNVIVIDDTRNLLDVVRDLTWFNVNESCGKCTPCREGVRRMAEILDRAADGSSRRADRDDLLALCEIVSNGSICGLGEMAPDPIRSALNHFSLPGLQPYEESMHGHD